MFQASAQIVQSFHSLNCVFFHLPVHTHNRNPKEARNRSDSLPETSYQMPFIVVGFDQDLEAFEILSFWGNSWAADGYLWVDYEDFGKFVTDGFVVLPHKEEEKP